MTGKNLLGKLTLIALLALASQSCKKENGIDNNNVILKPYALYVADYNGTIMKTNDGSGYKTIFPGGGGSLRAIVTSKANLLIVKDSAVFLSTNDGASFNPIRDTLVRVPSVDIPWPYFILDVPALNRIYITNGRLGTGKVAQSPENGTYFLPDTSWTPGDTPYVFTSYTFADNNILYGYSPGGSKFAGNRLFKKTGKDSLWVPIPTDLISPYNFYLTHSGNTLIATDYDGVKGAWYSVNNGVTFKQYSGLPTTMLYCTYSAFEKILVGTKDMGIYVFDNTSRFVPANSGLAPKTTVYSIVAKENIYKNDVSKKFFYIATNTGLYRSEDLAKSWVLVKQGNYRMVQ